MVISVCSAAAAKVASTTRLEFISSLQVILAGGALVLLWAFGAAARRRAAP